MSDLPIEPKNHFSREPSLGVGICGENTGWFFKEPNLVTCEDCKDTDAYQQALGVDITRRVEAQESELVESRNGAVKADAIMEAISLARYHQGQSFVYTADLIELRARYLTNK